MMATNAIHKTGDISREEPNLCIIHNKDAENYIGTWVFGLANFVNVKFPKATTRELTDEEKRVWHGNKYWNITSLANC